jgi:transposase
VERTFAWLHNYRRLRIRRERNLVVHMAFLTLACALICRGATLGSSETGS